MEVAATGVSIFVPDSSNNNNNNKIAPLHFQSPIGQFLSQILINHPHLMPAAVDVFLSFVQIMCGNVLQIINSHTASSLNLGGIVNNTLRPSIPKRCDSEWKKLMEECWSPDPEARPTFTEVKNRLRNMSAALQKKRPNVGIR